MFDNIAPAYDRLNRAMSFGLDRSWRRRAVDIVAKTQPKKIIDIATGTGDFAISLAQAMPQASVAGVDLSEGMVEIGREKVTRAGLSGRINLLIGDCLNEPLPAESADAITVAFGVRNFADLAKGYRAMYSMLRPGGVVCVIELSTPTSWLVKPFYKLYTRGFIPLMGRAISADRRAYSYLPESIAAVPQGFDMLELLKNAGFVNTKFITLTLGVCTIYLATKPTK